MHAHRGLRRARVTRRRRIPTTDFEFDRDMYWVRTPRPDPVQTLDVESGPSTNPVKGRVAIPRQESHHSPAT